MNVIASSAYRSDRLRLLDVSGASSVAQESWLRIAVSGRRLRWLRAASCASPQPALAPIGSWVLLQHLDLSASQKLTTLPESIGGCAQLAHLDLGRCEALTALPDSIGGCAQLAHLDLGWCKALTRCRTASAAARGWRTSTWAGASR
jgi:hypothetical protein